MVSQLRMGRVGGRSEWMRDVVDGIEEPGPAIVDTI